MVSTGLKSWGGGSISGGATGRGLTGGGSWVTGGCRATLRCSIGCGGSGFGGVNRTVVMIGGSARAGPPRPAELNFA